MKEVEQDDGEAQQFETLYTVEEESDVSQIRKLWGCVYPPYYTVTNIPLSRYPEHEYFRAVVFVLFCLPSTPTGRKRSTILDSTH